ncbi:hypothetical protein TNCV_4787331 [Trichonephila clavipes]|nr:hypothetical protein TNCV_4787331 [Trichonephila clavipes]
MNPGSIDSIKIVASVFGGIVASERTLAACIDHCHICPPTGLMIWCAIGCTFWSILVRIDDTLNSARYISGVLRPVVLPFIRAL